MLKLFQKDLFTIRNLLAADENLRKLLYYDGDSPLNETTPPVTALDSYITLSPFLTFEGDNTRERNNMVNIILLNILPQDEMSASDGLLQINIATNVDKWLISGNQIRPLAIADIIINKLNNLKIHTANRLQFSSLDYYVLNKRVAGYELTFTVVDGASEITNF